MDILDRIIMLMGSRDQKELTKYLQLNAVAFSDWKSGKSNSYKKYLIEIAKFLTFQLIIWFMEKHQIVLCEQMKRNYSKIIIV